MKPARAVVAATPGLSETLQRDWRKAARFYARFGITETRFRHGAPPAACLPEHDHFRVLPGIQGESRSETRIQEEAKTFLK